MEFYAPASPGTESLLRDELCELGFAGVRLNRGGIPFRGEWIDGWQACLYSRIAQRIQALMATFQATSPEQLYTGVRSVDWTPFLSPNHTLAVSAFCRSPRFSHSGFVALKVKDALVDQVREACGERPDVDRENPDVRVFVYISDDKVKLYLDLSGEALYKRGYRAAAGEAPMRETLAAALLRASGWDRISPLADPMCGSGTIAIEAALWAGNVAPGLLRKTFGFERWACFGDEDREVMRRLRGEARHNAHRQSPRIIASDCDATVLATAKANAAVAGVRIQWRQARIEECQLGDNVRTVVTNPPYDERLELTPVNLRGIVAAISRMHGKRICLLSGNPGLRKAIATAPSTCLPMKNGNLDCEVLVYQIPDMPY